jgi:hypothetical protein
MDLLSKSAKQHYGPVDAPIMFHGDLMQVCKLSQQEFENQCWNSNLIAYCP